MEAHFRTRCVKYRAEGGGRVMPSAAKLSERCLLTSLWWILLSFRPTGAVDTDLTVEVGPGVQECFYQNIEDRRGTTLEVEYQVIDGGDLDISFYIQGPDGKILAIENKKSDSAHKIAVVLAGTYKLCFDNTFSRFSKKVVYFDIMIDDEKEEDAEDENWDVNKVETIELMDVKFEYFRSIVDGVKENLDKSIQIQNFLKMFEARDRNIQETNFETVNWWSGIQLFVMVSVALTQVFMIRSLFDDHSKLGNMFRTRT